MLLQDFVKRFLKKKKSFYRRHFSGSLLSLEFKLDLKRFISASELAPLLIYKSFIYYRAETRLTGPVLPDSSYRTSSFSCNQLLRLMLQFLKKLNYTQNWAHKQYIKHSHQNLFVIICRLPSPTKYFYNWNIKRN